MKSALKSQEEEEYEEEEEEEEQHRHGHKSRKSELEAEEEEHHGGDLAGNKSHRSGTSVRAATEVGPQARDEFTDCRQQFMLQSCIARVGTGTGGHRTTLQRVKIGFYLWACAAGGGVGGLCDH